MNVHSLYHRRQRLSTFKRRPIAAAHHRKREEIAMDFEDAASDALPLALRASWNVPLPIDATSPWLFQLQPEHIFFAVLAILLGTLLAIGAAIMLRRVARPVRS